MAEIPVIPSSPQGLSPSALPHRGQASFGGSSKVLPGPCSGRWVIVATFFSQDLKPGNLAVNEDCELKVSLGGERTMAGLGPFHSPTALLDFWPRQRNRTQTFEPPLGGS